MRDFMRVLSLYWRAFAHLIFSFLSIPDAQPGYKDGVGSCRIARLFLEVCGPLLHAFRQLHDPPEAGAVGME
jgi:hypothetical protein